LSTLLGIPLAKTFSTLRASDFETCSDASRRVSHASGGSLDGGPTPTGVGLSACDHVSPTLRATRPFWTAFVAHDSGDQVEPAAERSRHRSFLPPLLEDLAPAFLNLWDLEPSTPVTLPRKAAGPPSEGELGPRGSLRAVPAAARGYQIASQVAIGRLRCLLVGIASLEGVVRSDQAIHGRARIGFWIPGAGLRTL
jgi:hypothetical protein